MDTYDRAAYLAARQVTRTYSTSFSLASRFFARDLRDHIYAIYGLVRIADEIVDSFRPRDAADLLRDLETETMTALGRGYSTNIIVHGFALTARKCNITADLIGPFFASMRMDLDKSSYDPSQYRAYIHGSAEVVGLMCLRVVCLDQVTDYNELAPGAASLGAAFQKVNFLRDLRDDHDRLGRYYFPTGTYETFSDAVKSDIIADIRTDFRAAAPAIERLPTTARTAVEIARNYYLELLRILDEASAADILAGRLSVPSRRKFVLMAATVGRGRLPGSHAK